MVMTRESLARPAVCIAFSFLRSFPLVWAGESVFIWYHLLYTTNEEKSQEDDTEISYRSGVRFAPGACARDRDRISWLKESSALSSKLDCSIITLYDQTPKEFHH